MTTSKVLMIGPGLEEQGGITAVVKNYYACGLNEKCHLTYLPVTKKAGRIGKLVFGSRALLWFWANAGSYDIVHVHLGGGASFYRESLFANRAAEIGVKTVLHVHAGQFKTFFAGLSHGMQQKVLNTFQKMDAVIALTDGWRQYFENEISRCNNVVSIPNGVFIPDVSGGKIESASILFLGHFDANKNADILLRAMKKVIQECPDTVANFGADGDIEKNRALARSLGIAQACNFLGWVDFKKKKELLLENSIFCLPSKIEGLPMGLLEAMAYGLTPVVTPVGGMAEVVQHEVNGLFVPVDDENALADALIDLIEDRVKRAKLGKAARGTIEDRYSMSNTADSLLSLYESLLGES